MKDREFIESVISNLYLNNISLKQDEKILVFTDRESSEELFAIALFFADVAKNFSQSLSFISYPSVDGHGKEPPESLWIETFGELAVKELKKNSIFDKLINKSLPPEKMPYVAEILTKFAVDPPRVIVALSHYSTSHTQFRYILTKFFKSRYCSMPLFQKEMFYSSLQEDFVTLKRRTLFLKDKLRDASFVDVRSGNGTYLRFSVVDREFLADTGDLSADGSFSNIPAGEVFTAPREGTANGKLVIEYSPTSKLEHPLTLWVEDGVIVKIDGDDPYKDTFIQKLKLDTNNSNLAELGIGTNSSANNLLNILESEKILGTIHIAFGDNSSFGGETKAKFHEDYLLQKPTVEIFKKSKENFFILIDGKPLFK